MLLFQKVDVGHGLPKVERDLREAQAELNLQFWEEHSEEISSCSNGFSREITDDYADDFVESLEEGLKLSLS